MRISVTDLKIIFRHPTVWVAALGYFVDVYDLVLFGIVRVQSLKDLGVSEEAIFGVGARLLNLQMVGMLLGGWAFGWAADRFGRLRSLFFSIAVYSGANLANSFVTDVRTYEVLRFFAGFGLAGELGIAITLVSESLPTKIRGLGSSVVGLAGFLGAISSVVVSGNISWRAAYLLGGVFGFSLLALRFKSRESPIFSALGKTPLIQTERRRWSHILSKAAKCVMIGTPVWFVSGLFFYFAPELARSLEITSPVLAGTAILLGYLGSIFGDIAGGFLTQKLQSRKNAVQVFLLFSLLLTAGFIFVLKGQTSAVFYIYCALLGIANGYWALFVSLSAEQFGTNIRATAATTIPNLVRATVVPMMAIFAVLNSAMNHHAAVLVIGLVCVVCAVIALYSIEDTFNRDLEFKE